MPRANWKGVISFGLVSIPIILHPSQNKAADISFHQIDKRDNSRIKYQRINVNTGKVVPWEEITRGYEYEKDNVIPVPDEILKHVAGDKARIIDIENFVDKKDFDMVALHNIYYLVPDKKGDKGYVILREALQETNKMGIAKVFISTKEYLAAVMPYQKALILCLLRYDNEIKKVSELNIPDKELATYKVNKKEIDVAKKLIQSMSSKWKPEKYHDEYKEAVHKWIEDAVNNIPHTPVKKRSTQSTNVVNFVDLLRKSLASQNKSKKLAKKTKAKKIKRNVTKHKSYANQAANKH